MFQNGTLPVESEQFSTGTIRVYPDRKKEEKIVLYARVSSHDQKEDLNRPLNRLKDFAAAKGFIVSQEVSKIGSGLNGHRRKLNAILSDPLIILIIVEHKDRLARFGVEMREEALSASDRCLLVVNETEYKADLMPDFIDVVTSMCARIYGKRSARNKAKKALASINDKPSFLTE
jgi:predicted site-specific integrase-resolvase